MEETRYGLRVDVPVPYEVALERITAALQEQGFGVLTSIDVQQTLKKKLDRDFRHPAVVAVAKEADVRLRAALARLEADATAQPTGPRTQAS